MTNRKEVSRERYESLLDENVELQQRLAHKSASKEQVITCLQDEIDYLRSELAQREKKDDLSADLLSK